MRVFLDTNILLDVLMNRTLFVVDSEAVITSCEARGDDLFVAWHGLATAYYLLKRGRSEADTMVEVDKILAWASVAKATDAAARRARSLGFSDFEDALQAASAEACHADWIVTRNAADFGLSAVAAITPQDFLLRFPVMPVS
ncbi:MAG: PIN domain-containing protein [Prosthecobacter sp.]|uniref:PIN domain-containing protein n=1 Tax=Prosthecobacter sp. TaxID=1965333 RepID=UPI003902D959